jgi:DNA-directed RNA polymerase specialized sigma24 family protein
MPRSLSTSAAPSGHESRERFARHFPGVFAYACGMTGDEEAARETAIAAFSAVLRAGGLTDDDFALALFTAARTLTQPKVAASPEGLSVSEQEIISLLFDARLSRAQISALLGIQPEMLAATLLSGLKKVSAAMQGPATDITALPA